MLVSFGNSPTWTISNSGSTQTVEVGFFVSHGKQQCNYRRGSFKTGFTSSESLNYEIIFVHIYRLLHVKSLISFLFTSFLIPYRERASLRASERYGIKNE